MNDIIKEKLKQNKKNINQINNLKKKINLLKKEINNNNLIINKHCIHKWIYDTEFFSYDERPKKCIYCGAFNN